MEEPPSLQFRIYSSHSHSPPLGVSLEHRGKTEGGQEEGVSRSWGRVSGDGTEEKEAEKTARITQKGAGGKRERERERSPLLSWRSQPLQLTSICEIRPLWKLAHCRLGAELYGCVKERRPDCLTLQLFLERPGSPLS